MKKFFAAMVLAGLVAVPMTFGQDAPKEAPKAEKTKKKSGKKKVSKKKTEEPKQQ